jgi:hypothetical protein
LTPFWVDMPVRIERYTLLSWSVPAERLLPFIPGPLRLETTLAPNQPEMAFLSLFVGQLRLRPFGVALLPLSYAAYRTSVRYQNKLGSYSLRSVVDSTPLAATARGALGLSVHKRRLRIRWQETGRAEASGDEIQLRLSAERAAFGLRRGAVENTLCPPLTYWLRRDGKISMAKVEQPGAAPLSGNIENIFLPWPQEMGLLSSAEMNQPHSIFFVSRRMMRGELAEAALSFAAPIL